MRKKKLTPGEPFADLLGKLIQVPKAELDAQLRPPPKPKKKRRKKK